MMGAPAFVRWTSLVAAGWLFLPAQAGLLDVDRLTIELPLEARGVSRMALSASGHLYALDRGENRLWMFAPDGKFVRGIGRPGRGPGEYENIRSYGLNGDTVWLFDERQDRLTLLTDTGRVLSTITPARLQWKDPVGGSAVRPVAMLPNGELLVTHLHHVVASSGGYTHNARSFHRVPRSAIGGKEPPKILATIGSVAVRNRSLAMSDGDLSWQTTQPWGGSDLSAISSSGRAYAQIVFDTVTPSTAPILRLEVVLNGAATGTTRLDYTPVRIEDAMVEAAFEKAWADTMLQKRTTRARARAAYLHGLYRPKFLPPFDGLAIADDGTVWIRRASAADSSAVWDVREPTGKLVGKVRLSAAFTIMAATRNSAWGTEPGPDDNLVIARYSIRVR
jgi:hypothetical protein